MSIGLATDGYYGSGGGLSDGDVDPPVVVAMSPLTDTDPGEAGGFPADWSFARGTPVVISITDVDPGVSFVAVTVELVGFPMQTAYRMGAFVGDYVINSHEDSLPTGLQLTLLPTEGWVSQPDVTQPSFLIAHVDAVDFNGNFSHTDLIWRLPPEVPPVVEIPDVATGLMNHASDALNRLVTQMRGDLIEEFDVPSATSASFSITHNATTLRLTARRSGLLGNAVGMSNDDASGAQPPVVVDIGTIVFLSSSATSTFGEIAAAINSNSSLVSASVTGDPAELFLSVTGLFTGNLSGGLDG